MREFVEKLEMPEESKQRLMDMTPATYIGNATAQALDIVANQDQGSLNTEVDSRIGGGW